MRAKSVGEHHLTACGENLRCALGQGYSETMMLWQCLYGGEHVKMKLLYECLNDFID